MPSATYTPQYLWRQGSLSLKTGREYLFSKSTAVPFITTWTGKGAPVTFAPSGLSVAVGFDIFHKDLLN